MRLHDLSRAYQSKTDEELIHLGTEADQLTPEALSALKGELANRRLDIAARVDVQSECAPVGIQQAGISVTLPESRGVAEFVTDVLGIYHSHFWSFIWLTLPAVVVGFIAVYLGRHQALEIQRRLPRGIALRGHEAEILQLGLANYAGYLVSWFAFSFSFGAICSAVSQIEGKFVPSVSYSFSAVRERLGAFLRLSFLLFVLLIVALAVSGVLSLGMVWIVSGRHAQASHLTIQIVSIGFSSLALLALSRFALAMPAVILDNCRVGQSMFRSDALTAGKWFTLAGLLAKSLVGGYLAGMCPFWLARWMLASVPLPTWFPWVLNCASIFGITVVEPTMFIGFALLYLRTMALCIATEEVSARQLV